MKKKYFVIIGGLWFDKVNGNTYHNTKVIECDTKNIYYTGFDYGYGSSYYYDGERYIKNNFKNYECIIINGGSFYITKKECKNKWF